MPTPKVRPENGKRREYSTKLQKNRENTLAFQKNRSDRVSNSARCYLFSASLAVPLPRHVQHVSGHRLDHSVGLANRSRQLESHIGVRFV